MAELILPLSIFVLPLLREALEKILPALEARAAKTETPIDDGAVTVLQYVCIVLDGVVGILPKVKFGARGSV